MNKIQKLGCLVGMIVMGGASLVRADSSIASPDGKLSVRFSMDGSGAPRYEVMRDGNPVLLSSRLGLVRDDADFTQGLKLLSETDVMPVADDYEIRTAKRSHNHYRANRRTFRLASSQGSVIEIIFQVSNDGVAFRYHFPESSTVVRTLSEEVSSFRFPDGTRAWLQPIAESKNGWARANPSYEEHYQMEIPVGTTSTLGAGWVFPALFRSGDTWLLVSESSLSRGFCGSRLRHESPGGEYQIGYSDPRECVVGKPSNPTSTLPWTTPWRLIVIGDLKTVAESTLGIDLAEPARFGPPARPNGKASWSWPLLGDSMTTYEVQKKFVDYAAEMKWRYCLVDALWDTQIGYEKMEDLVDYARKKKVEILVWYNSNGNWNDAPQSPNHMLDTHEKRIEEFARLKKMGVAGLKIDFFGGDGSSMIDYYIDLLEDAQPFGFLMNFHGCTLPRGWERTYPNLMTMEAVKGLEYCTFEQSNADKMAPHAAMLPFTRNVFDPMDFTPMVLDKFPNGRIRRTTPAFELALSVLFTSGIQHYAEIPEGLQKVPDYVKQFLKKVPSVWDDVRFIDGYPGKYVVMARLGDGRWYVTGINSETNAKTLTFDLSPFKGRSGTLICDGDDAGFAMKRIGRNEIGEFKISIPPNGGFVLLVE
ncbi:MAG: glycoside hydrolase family 97 catalytic domain-containing protein [Pontiellaceae bacterium]|nr:glycoside hydrolase family 97 catalytic domain-containing protein [Pontiellaceae bacterium]MBN2786420.1 glycoside hydrolase family 97 catalytic domain-containing protein [Pontiellaceae bacterium]